MKNTTELGIITALLASTGFLAGCGQVASPAPLTLAVTATSNEPAPSTAALTDILHEHAAGALLPKDGMVTVVTPDTTVQVDLTPMRGDEVESGLHKIAEKIDDNLDRLDRTLGAAAATSDGLDVIGVLDRALETTPAGGTVLLVTSGYSTVAPLDLNAAGAWIANPAGVVTAADTADLPDATGKHMRFLGLGYPNPASRQQTAGPAARDALGTILTGLCSKMGALSCDVLPGPAGTGAPASSNTVPIVPLDQVTTHCVGQVDIDTTIAFAPESPVLQPVIDAQLTPIAEALAKCPTGTTIHAVGHSAAVPDPSWGGGSDLEEQRAQAVLTRLLELGAPAHTLGAATAGGQIVDNMPGGQYREDLAIRNRIVTLTITR